MSIFHFNCMRFFALCSFVVLLVPSSSAEDYQVVDVSESQIGSFLRTVTKTQVGDHSLNQFTMHRWVRTGAQQHAIRGNLLLLSGLGGNFSTFELHESGSKLRSMAAFFARRGFAVYGYSPRVTDLPAGECESGADCSIMATWDIASMVSDIHWIRGQMEADFPGKKTVIGGLSLGAINTIATLNAYPQEYDGAIIWEGMLYSNDPEVLALNAQYCAIGQDLIDNGVFYDAQGIGFFKQTAALAEVDPDSPSPFAALFGLPPETTNHQVFVFGLSEELPGPTSMPTPGYISMAGDWTPDRLFFADEARVFDDIASFNNYTPNVIVRDISCALAGVLTQHTNNLGAFQGQIMAIRSGRGFGAYMGDNLALFSSASIHQYQVEPFGHVDHFFSPFHKFYLELPIHAWLSAVVLP